MPRKPKRSKVVSRSLTLEHLDLEEMLELTCGPDHRGSAFESEFLRVAAWKANRDVLTTRNPGQRPWAWWHYEAPGERRVKRYRINTGITGMKWVEQPEPDHEFLERHGLLSDDERAHIAAIEAMNGGDE